MGTRTAGEYFPLLFRVLTNVLDRNMESIFSISFRKDRDQKKEKKELVNIDYQNLNLRALENCGRHEPQTGSQI